MQSRSSRSQNPHKWQLQVAYTNESVMHQMCTCAILTHLLDRIVKEASNITISKGQPFDQADIMNAFRVGGRNKDFQMSESI